MSIWLALLFGVLSWLWLRRPRRPEGFPPGPPTFFIFGNLFTVVRLLTGDVRQMLLSRRQKYGDINGVVATTGMHIINITKYEDIRDACSMPELCGRPQAFLMLIRSYMKKMGIIFNDGPLWMEHRRFALRHLKDLGLGKSSMDEAIISEFELLREEMMQDIGKPMLVNSRFNLAVLNVLWRIVASERFDSRDPQAQKYVSLVNSFFSEVGPSNVLNVAPWLRYLFPGLTGYSLLVQQREATLEMFRRLVLEHRAALDRQNPRDYIDHFLLEMDTEDAAERGFTDLNLAVNGMDFFIAGMETTASALSWALFFMVTHPDVQRRVQDEIDAVLGGRRPTGHDRPRLPLADATVMEVLRLGTVIPRAVPHAASAGPVPFRGHVIPHGAIVMMDLAAVHRDAAYWGDPDAFRPERFLSADGRTRRDERLIPFGVGRRSCLGEQLARRELFLMFVSLLQSFSFAAVDGETLSPDGEYGALFRPRPFHVTYTARQ